MGVNVVKLGDFVKIQTGKLDANAADENGLYPFFTCAVEPLTINKYAYDCECILIAGNGDLNVKYYNGKFNAYQRTYIIEVIDKTLDVRYLYHFLTKYINVLRQNSIGGVIKYIKLGDLTGIKLPLPTIEQQKRIVSLLDKADGIRAKKKLANDKLDEFLKSTFISMFGDPVKNTKNLDIVKVIDVCDCMVPGRDKPKSFTGNIPWITIDDLKINGITYKSKNNMGLTETEISGVKRKTIPTGSVIMSCVGNLGLCSIAGQPMVINQQLHSFQCSEKINNIYLMFVLGQMTGYMTKNASSTTVLYMNKTVCNSIPILLPNIVEQNKFAQIVEKVEAQKQKNEFVIEQMNNLFNSLSQRAFKGEL